MRSTRQLFLSPFIHPVGSMKCWRGRPQVYVLLGLIFGLLLLVTGPREVCAQAAPTDLLPPVQGASETWIPSLNGLRQNAADVVQGPIPRTKRERRLVVGTAGVLVAIVATLDEATYREVSPRSGQTEADGMSRTTASLARPGEWYGRRDADRFAAQTVGALAASGIVLRRPALTQTSLRTLESILYTDALVGVLKSVLNRDRPYVGASPDPFSTAPGLFSPEHTRLSMPSGHAGRAFSIATVLAHQSGRRYVAVPLYAGAASVSIERVRSGHHWLSDVAVGAAIGFFVGRSVSERRDEERRSLRVVPILSAGHAGLAVRL